MFQIKMCAYPVLPLLVTAAILAVLVAMAFSDDPRTRTSLDQSLGAWGVFLAMFGVRVLLARRKKTTTHEHHTQRETEVPEVVR